MFPRWQDRWTGSKLSSSGCGWPDRRPAASWPTGAPTSSRSNRPPVIPAGCSAGCSACDDGVEPAVRDGQPLQAQHRAGPHHRRRTGDRARIDLRRRCFHHQRPARRAASPRPGLSGGSRAQPAPGVRTDHRIRRDRSRRQPAGLRRRRLLGPLRGGRPADQARRHPAVPARRDGRSPDRDDAGRGDQRRTGGPRPHRRGPTGQHLAVPAGRLHRQLRPQHVPAERTADRDRPAGVDGQPVHEQLRRGRRAAVLDRRTGGRPALAAAVPRRRTPGVVGRQPICAPHATAPGTPPS